LREGARDGDPIRLQAALERSAELRHREAQRLPVGVHLREWDAERELIGAIERPGKRAGITREISPPRAARCAAR